MMRFGAGLLLKRFVAKWQANPVGGHMIGFIDVGQRLCGAHNNMSNHNICMFDKKCHGEY